MTETPAAAARWLIRFSGGDDARVRLICIPHAGGGAMTFQSWAKELPSEIELFAVQLPGREKRVHETPVRSLNAIIEPLAAEVAALADRPLVIFGHSFGAILAFELAHRLRDRADTTVSALLVSGSSAPQLPRRAPRLAHLPSREIVFRIAELYGNIPVALLEEPQYVQLMGRAMQADLEILENYQHSDFPPLPCPIATFGGDRDPAALRTELEAWQQQAGGPFSSTLIAGDHFYFKSPAGQRALLDGISEHCLAASAMVSVG